MLPSIYTSGIPTAAYMCTRPTSNPSIGSHNSIVPSLTSSISSYKHLAYISRMRASCNGCRILRKGCGDDCAIRPCLEWIKSPDSQSHATFFLAKFYGRAGLLNLLLAAPERHRIAVFRSLLYEACGRIVSPTHGAVGLLWSGNWQLCQAAVDAVLQGSPIVQMASDTVVARVPLPPPLQAFDIRHVHKDEMGGDLHRVAHTSRAHFKRSGAHMSGTYPRWGQFYMPAGQSNEEKDGDNMSTTERSTISTLEERCGLELDLCL